MINSKVNGIRLFYGNAKQPYVSKDHEKCEVNEKAMDTKVLKTWEVTLDEAPKKDDSLVRRRGLQPDFIEMPPTKDSGMSEGEVKSKIMEMMNDGIDSSSDLYKPIMKLGWPWKFILPPILIPILYQNYMSKYQGLPKSIEDRIPEIEDLDVDARFEPLRYQKLPGIFGFKEDATEEEVNFVKIAYLTAKDPLEIYKQFKGKKKLKPGDKVEVHVVFSGAKTPIVYYEKLMGPWEVTTVGNKFDIKFSGNIKGNIEFGREKVPDGYLFGFKGSAGHGELIYEVTFKGLPGGKIKIDKVNK